MHLHIISYGSSRGVKSFSHINKLVLIQLYILSYSEYPVCQSYAYLPGSCISFVMWASVASQVLSWADYVVTLFFFSFLGRHSWHMEVPRLGVESELLLLAYTIAAATLDLSHICSATYTTVW